MERKRSPGGGKSRGKGLREEGDQGLGAPLCTQPTRPGLGSVGDPWMSQTCPQGVPSLTGETYGGPDGCSL